MMSIKHFYKSLWFWVILMHLILIAAWVFIIMLSKSV